MTDQTQALQPESEAYERAIAAFHMAARRRSFANKHTVMREGEPPDNLYLVLEGSVSIVLEDDEGHEMVLAYLGKGQFFGEMGLFPELNTRSALVRTRQETVVSEMGYDRFRALTKDHPDLIWVLAGQLAERLRATSRNAIDLAFMDVAGRVARTILNLAAGDDTEKQEHGRVVRISRQELARIVGCSREMAGRVLKQLEDDGVVQVNGRNILVLDAGLKIDEDESEDE